MVWGLCGSNIMVEVGGTGKLLTLRSPESRARRKELGQETPPQDCPALVAGLYVNHVQASRELCFTNNLLIVF